MPSHTICGGIKHILCDSSGKGHLATCAWFLPDLLSCAFDDFILYPFTVINHNHEHSKFWVLWILGNHWNDVRDPDRTFKSNLLNSTLHRCHWLFYLYFHYPSQWQLSELEQPYNLSFKLGDVTSKRKQPSIIIVIIIVCNIINDNYKPEQQMQARTVPSKVKCMVTLFIGDTIGQRVKSKQRITAGFLL